MVLKPPQLNLEQELPSTPVAWGRRKHEREFLKQLPERPKYPQKREFEKYPTFTHFAPWVPMWGAYV